MAQDGEGEVLGDGADGRDVVVVLAGVGQGEGEVGSALGDFDDFVVRLGGGECEDKK